MKLWRSDGRKAELDEEIGTHLRLAIADRMARGESEAEARVAAEREMGNLPLTKDVTRETWGWVWMERLGQDFRYALRQMRRSPGFAATVIGTLALGIGAAAAMLTVVDHALLRPLPFKDAKRLVSLDEKGRETNAFWNAPWVDIAQWKAESRSFEDMAFSSGLGGRAYLEGKDSSLQVDGQKVSPNLFAMLGAKPELGRAFIAEEPGFGAAKNVGGMVLSHQVWELAFGSDKGILGRVVRVNDEPYTVVGVMPADFDYPASQSPFGQVWTVIQLGAKDQGRDYDSEHSTYEVIARLRPLGDGGSGDGGDGDNSEARGCAI